jgi:Tol biopolymer transport system component
LRRPFLLVAILAAGVLAAAASGSGRAPRIRLAYSSATIAPLGVFRVEPGAKPVRVSAGRGDGFPAWSPDGKSIAFDHPVNLPSNNPLCTLVVATGTSSKAVPGVRSPCRGISWGRNGLIAFNDSKNAVWVVKADGSGLKKIVNASDGSTLNPAWSPDGKMLAFGNGVAGGITVAGANGRGLHTITKPAFGSGDGYPAWSPNGKAIAFVRANPDFTWSVVVVHSDGTGAKTLAKVQNQPDWVRPTWTADSSSIVFGDVYGISIVSASGGASRILVRGQSLVQPAVAPK